LNLDVIVSRAARVRRRHDCAKAERTVGSGDDMATIPEADVVGLGAFGSGASGSSIIRTRLLAPLGTPSHASGGETSSPSQVYFEGM
jgi:hypothetical protein